MTTKLDIDPALPLDGNREEIARLYDRYALPVQVFFGRRGIPPDECHDLTQETFLRACRGRDGFRGDAPLDKWLFTIAANVWRNTRRDGTADKRDGEELALEDEVLYRPVLSAREDDPLTSVLAGERRTILYDAVRDLPDQMRRCLLFRIDRELKYREIAAVMQISIETVKSQIFQARERLRTRLAAHFPELSA